MPQEKCKFCKREGEIKKEDYKDTGCCPHILLLICPVCKCEIREVDTRSEIPQGDEYWKLSH